MNTWYCTACPNGVCYFETAGEHNPNEKKCSCSKGHWKLIKTEQPHNPKKETPDVTAPASV